MPMHEISLIFPHQLFEKNPVLSKARKVVLLEEFLFFRQYKFHRHKLAFHRASMKAYQHNLEKQGYVVDYINAHEAHGEVQACVAYLSDAGVEKIHTIDPVDDWLERRLQKSVSKVGLKIDVLTSPMFMNDRADMETYFSGRKRLLHHDFYRTQRRKFDILVDSDNQPLGGRWSYDSDNRRRYPKKQPFPERSGFDLSPVYQEAIRYVDEHFPDSPGKIDGAFLYPIDHKQARQELEDFLEHRFMGFGTYEDAMVEEPSILNHSLLSAVLNNGLITPKEVLDRTLAFAKEHQIPMNDLEGFVRQIVGWREFVRGIYQCRGREMRTQNFWGFHRTLPQSFYQGTTGLKPFDASFAKLEKTSYSHHIERLMIFGNLMLLCEIHPDEVYRWFMEWYIDAYDWVMVPNVYGMSQYADGGSMVTKPYISSSNYILKMSHYKKGPWCEIWDGLFWRFMFQNRSKLKSNPRLSMLMKVWEKKSPDQQAACLNNAEDYFRQAGF
jgi:deoxyribodipyrimidine photolyase-related protein